jgi:exodeoxyribonuclease VII large subunit
VVTSAAGAAIRDFLQILRRRAPHIAVFIAPVRVQGRGAAAEIAAAIGQFSEAARSGFPPVDVLVVTRGGGSLEDLWEFNEENVARAIAACAVPVISAVGHETDVTTSDLVADVRAPTPSAAAEILSSDRGDMLERLRTGTRRLTRDVSIHLQRARANLSAMTDSGVFARPARRLSDLRQRNDDLTEQAAAAVDAKLRFLRNALSKTSAVLAARSPARQLTVWGQRLSALQRQQRQAIAAALRQRKQAAARRAQAVELLGPQRTLQRGFTITMDDKRRPLTSAARAAAEDEIITLFADGEVRSQPE